MHAGHGLRVDPSQCHFGYLEIVRSLNALFELHRSSGDMLVGVWIASCSAFIQSLLGSGDLTVVTSIM